jgi:hypothetical protein
VIKGFIDEDVPLALPAAPQVLTVEPQPAVAAAALTEADVPGQPAI